MWIPLEWAGAWGAASQRTAIENARVAAIACSQARVERAEVEQYVAELAARRRQESLPA
jgi:hypothetical protein